MDSKMTLGEAIILGQAALGKYTNRDWLYSYVDGNGDKQWCGCAFGGALVAVGLGEEYVTSGGDMREVAYKSWPWLRTDHFEMMTHLYGGVLEKTRTIEEMAAICDSWAPVAAPAPALAPKQPEPEPEPVTAPATGGHLFGRIWDLVDVMSMR
jgi:hypothetical protein